MPTLSTKLLPAALRAMTKKRECRVTVDNSRTVEPFGYWWDGGSRTEYTVFNLTTGRTRRPALPGGPPHFSGPAEPISLADDELLVTGGTFCGKPSQLGIQVPESLALQFAGIAHPRELNPETPLTLVRDWLADFGREADAERLTTFFGPLYGQ